MLTFIIYYIKTYWYIILYLLLELFNYIKYYLVKLQINKTYIESNCNIINKYKISDEVIKNILHHDKDPQKIIEHLFFNKVDIIDINKKSLSRALGFLLFSKKDLCSTELNYIDTYILQIENRFNIQIKDTDIIYQCIEAGHASVITWYYPLFIRCVKLCARKIIELYMIHYLKFKKYTYKAGIVIWIRIDENIKYNPLILFHCSLGIVGYPFIIPNIMKNRVLIIPEIAGILWNSFDISNPDKLSDLLYDKINELNINAKYDLLIHSYGFILSLKFLHKYHHIVNRIIAMESPIIINHSMESYHEFVNTIQHINFLDPISVICRYTTNRDTVIQYHFQRCTMSHNSSLIGFDDYSIEKDKNIHLVLSGNDPRVSAQHYIHYIKSKNLPYNVTVFEGREHGAYLYDNEFQEYILKLINT
jgi:hypothetical protein